MFWTKEEYKITTDKSEFDVDLIFNFLNKSAYWCKGVPREIVTKAIDNSLCFGIFHNQTQVGFARLITDKATFAYLADVFVIPELRGKGLSKWLVSCIQEHPELQGLRRIALATSDAHGLYAQFGFKPLAKPETFMEINFPDIYQQQSRTGLTSKSR